MSDSIDKWEMFYNTLDDKKNNSIRFLFPLLSWQFDLWTPSICCIITPVFLDGFYYWTSLSDISNVTKKPTKTRIWQSWSFLSFQFETWNMTCSLTSIIICKDIIWELNQKFFIWNILNCRIWQKTPRLTPTISGDHPQSSAISWNTKPNNLFNMLPH